MDIDAVELGMRVMVPERTDGRMTRPAHVAVVVQPHGERGPVTRDGKVCLRSRYGCSYVPVDEVVLHETREAPL